MSQTLLIILLGGWLMMGAIQSVKYKGEMMIDWVNIKDRNLLIVIAVAALIATASVVPLIWR